MDPPSGRLKKEWLTRAKAPAKATKIIISANIRVLNRLFGLVSLVVGFSLVSLRQYYLVQVQWVDAA